MAIHADLNNACNADPLARKVLGMLASYTRRDIAQNCGISVSLVRAYEEMLNRQGVNIYELDTKGFFLVNRRFRSV